MDIGKFDVLAWWWQQQHKVLIRQKCPITWLSGFKVVAAAIIPRQSAHEFGKVSPHAQAAFAFPRRFPWYSCNLAQLNGNFQMIPSGIETATFRFVAQCSNQQRYRVPPQIFPHCRRRYLRPAHLKCSTIGVMFLNSSLSKQINELQIKHFVTVTELPSLLILTTVIYHHLRCLVQCSAVKDKGRLVTPWTFQPTSFYNVKDIILLALDEPHAERIKFYIWIVQYRRTALVATFIT